MTRFTYSSKPFFWALGIMGSPIRNPAVRIFSDSLRKYFLTASGRKTKMTLAKNIQSAEEYNHCLDQRFVQCALCHRLHLYHTERGGSIAGRKTYNRQFLMV